MPELHIMLPYPPSTNRYWRNVSGRTLISRAGRQYRQAVVQQVFFDKHSAGFTGRLSVSIGVYPPDKRRRDLDNVLKSLLDALEHANVYENDNQIDELLVKRHKVAKPGYVQVHIREISV